MQIRWTRGASCALVFLPLLFGLFLRRRTNHGHFHVLGGKTLLLTAHPDDETFFFSPTLSALSQVDSDVFVVSLSTGNAKGLGDVRRVEFTRALGVFGVGEERSVVLNHPGLQDNKTASWDPTLIAQVLYPFVVENNISTILTFDSLGITHHPNHRSTFAGASQLVSNSAWQQRLPPRLFTLRSQPETRHIGPLAAFLPPSTVHFTASLPDYITALHAMCQHKSQLRFVSLPFAKGLLSRYLWVNEWVQIVDWSE
ncbi:N-acetylglucosaminylphosphatidylinositoldeacety la se [Roridomyces roridus]|uniref:N-acetylglucosaminylphosphatidylinositol deacetylase n=1 Tax=Roridomyces roridus TaxID=1738132 RepID=A0AAD7C7L7_9AGAR|nr:N-acetylglucosaminylphosphatidylinositoldeacety la se [Roridomyces roridus]